MVVLYVDNDLVAAMKRNDIEEFLSKLKSEFKITTDS